MKPLTTVLAIVAVATAAGCATAPPGDAWLGPDKARHFVAGAVLSGGTTVMCRRQGQEDVPAAGIGIGVTLAFGAGKEWYDLRVKRTYWSWRDLTWDLVGAVAGGLVASAAE